MFDINILTDIANRIIPNTLCNTYMPPSPNIFSKNETIRIAMYITTTLATSEIKISGIEYSALKDNIVVNDPAPAIRGNTMGTNTLELAGESSVLNIFIPNIISNASANITNEPATAKDAISTLNSCSNHSPTNRNNTNVANEYSDAFVALTGLPCRL